MAWMCLISTIKNFYFNKGWHFICKVPSFFQMNPFMKVKFYIFFTLGKDLDQGHFWTLGLVLGSCLAHVQKNPLEVLTRYLLKQVRIVGSNSN
jgi:hypothetical protein